MKVIKFVKENRVIVFALCVVLLSFILLALPGQFAHYGPLNLSSKVASERFLYRLSGYQWIFGTVETKLGAKIGSASAQGIAAFVLLILSLFGLLFSKKSSFVSLLTSLVLITTAILFLSISAAGVKAYPNWHIKPEDSVYTLMRWVPYLIGSLVILAGLLMGYRTFKVMRDEVKRPVQSKGPSYNYLHK